MSESHRKYQQIGAQEDCPCGSGKKYIDCCLDGNIRWMVDESGKPFKMQAFKNVSSSATMSEDIPLLSVEVKDGNITYSKNSHISRLSGFPPEVLKTTLSVIEVEKMQTVFEAFGKYLQRTHFEDDVEEDTPEEPIPDGEYTLLMVSIDEETGQPLGMGGRRISHLIGESSLMTLIGAYEEIRTDLMLCLTVNCLMNGILGAVDYDDRGE